MNRARLAWVAGWLIQGFLAVAIPLVPDEAYYQDWSDHLALGYFDHPPMIAWWIALGGGHARLVGWLLAPLSAWMLADVARRIGVESPWRAPALMIWTPLGLVGGAMATPDIPLVFFWTAVIWAVFADRALLAGVAFAACLWSKSTILVAVPGLLFALPRRRLPVLAFAAALYAPHLWWSAQNEWLPWSFQATRTSAGSNFFEFLGGQALLVTPIIVAYAGFAWARVEDRVDRQLLALSLPALGAFVATAAFTRVEGNWPCFVWPAAVLLIVRGWPRLRMVWVLAALSLGAFGAVVVGAVMNLAPSVRAARLYRLPVVAARYQERALGGDAFFYLRARGHRPSQYDRWALPAPPACDYLYLAGADALGGRCPGPLRPREVGGRAATICRCETSTKINDSPK